MSPDKDGVYRGEDAENGVAGTCGWLPGPCLRFARGCRRGVTSIWGRASTRRPRGWNTRPRLISRQMGREDGVDLWTPEFEEEAAEPPVADGWSGLFVD